MLSSVTIPLIVAIVPDCWLWLPALCSIGATIAAALAHQPAELAHDRGLRRLAPERQSRRSW
jgi:hypothetical protein